ncbi:IS630 transposase-related protein [Holospora obtusa]|uniref:IS630 transposase-related protein n=1 Tax=Holospora obtusa TaxID=49893 RepID=UPI00094AB8FA
MIKKHYSLDLRERVIKYIKLGNTQNTTFKILKVSKNSVSGLRIRYQEAESIKAKPCLGRKGKINPEKLRVYVEGQ